MSGKNLVEEFSPGNTQTIPEPELCITGMYDDEEHLENLIRHVNMVRDNCVLLGKRLIKSGRVEFGQQLIANGFIHDASKFKGIERKYLHRGPDTPEEQLHLAVEQHVKANMHHPEFWGGIQLMPEIFVAELVTDWFARSMEMGTGLREWIESDAVPRFQIDKRWKQWEWIKNFVDMMLQNSFVSKKSVDP